jgi:hypothetical protein
MSYYALAGLADGRTNSESPIQGPCRRDRRRPACAHTLSIPSAVGLPACAIARSAGRQLNSKEIGLGIQSTVIKKNILACNKFVCFQRLQETMSIFLKEANQLLQNPKVATTLSYSLLSTGLTG